MKLEKRPPNIYRMLDFHNYYCNEKGDLFTKSDKINTGWCKRIYRKNYLFVEELFIPTANKKKTIRINRQNVIDIWNKMNSS